MAGTASKTDPKLWERIKADVTRSGKGGKPGQWSARKAQLATQAYKAEGGGYRGAKSADNHLRQWTEEDWGTKSGAKSEESGERYLPRATRDGLTDDEYRRSTAKKRADTAKGKQFSRQPKDVAKKAASARKGTGATARRGATKAELMKAAAARDVPGRSRMSKAELEKALAR